MKARFHPFNDLLLERYLANELSAEEARRVEEEASRRPELKAHLSERRAEKEAFKLYLRPLALPKAADSGRRFWVWAWAAAAAALLLLVAGLTLRPPASEIQMRGATSFAVSVAVLRGEAVFEYRDGVVLKPQDRIRLTVRVAEPGYLTVVGRDGGGVEQTLYRGLPVSGETTLPDSLELDDTPGPEHLLLYFSAQPGQLGSPAATVKLVKGVP